MIGKLVNSRFIRHFAEKKGKLIHNYENCVFCGKCSKVCRTGSIMVNFKEKSLQINQDTCIRCGQCTKACPKYALKIEK